MTGTDEVAEVTPNTNLDMWDRLKPTNPKFTKQFKGAGGFSGTALNAMYVIEKLTAEFGPCGMGWRFVLEDDRVQEGHTLKNGDKSKLHIVRGHIEYISDKNGVWYSTSPQFGQTMLVGENKYGTYTDEEAPKKSITDCIGKCAATIGIGADIFLGLFDDNKYVNQRKQEEAEAAPEPKPEKTALDPAKVEVKPTDVREVFYQIKGMIEAAKDNGDIDMILKGNKGGLDELERVSKVNWEGLKKIATDKRASFAPKDDPLNDELPDFA